MALGITVCKKDVTIMHATYNLSHKLTIDTSLSCQSSQDYAFMPEVLAFT